MRVFCRNAAILAALALHACGPSGPPPATPARLEVELVSETAARLTWLQSAAAEELASAYRIYRDGSFLLETETTSALDETLPPDRESCFTVSAISTGGAESELSDPVCVDPTTTWIPRLTGYGDPVFTVASGPERTLVGGQLVLGSADGREWQQQRQGSLLDLSWDGSAFVGIVPMHGPLRTATGRDGRSPGLDPFFRGVAIAGWDGRWILARADGVIESSTDFETWEAHDVGLDVSRGGALWTGTEFLVFSGVGPQLAASPDGETWSLRDAPATFRDVIQAGEQLVAFGRDERVYSSSDGVDWAGVPGPLVLSGAYSPDLDIYVAIGGQGEVWTSDDLSTWQREAPGGLESIALADIAWGAGHFTAVGGAGTVLTSDDGHGWSIGTTGAELEGLVQLPDRLIAAGSARSLQSTDGREWADLDEERWASNIVGLQIASSGEVFVQVVGGAIRVSDDLLTWEELPDGDRCTDVVFADDRFVALCFMSTLRSIDGRAWETIDRTEPALIENLTASPDGSLLYAARSGLMSTAMFYSADQGVTWDATPYSGSRPADIAVGDNAVVVRDSAQALHHSVDGSV